MANMESIGNINKSQISGLILAGGEGRRMSGQDKGLISLSKKPLIEYAIACIAPLVDDLSISCNRNQAKYSAYQLPCIADNNAQGSDPKNHFSGPMAGIASGLTHAKHEWLLVMPCDTPLMTTQVMTQLLEKINSGMSEVKGEVIEGRADMGTEQQAIIFSHQGLQPLHGLYHKSILPLLEKNLAENKNALQRLLHSIGGVHIIEAKNAGHSFHNANDINELNTIEKMLLD